YWLQNGADANIRDAQSRPAIFWEAVTKHRKLPAMLVSAGADLSVLNEARQTPLQYYLSLMRSDVAQAILQRPADENSSTKSAGNSLRIHHQDSHGRTALMYALALGNMVTDRRQIIGEIIELDLGFNA